MKKAIFIFSMFCSLNSFAQGFDCVSYRGMDTQPEHFYRIHGSFSRDSGIGGVFLSLTHKSDSDDHEIVKVSGSILPDISFHPHSGKLLEFKKFILESSKLDSFLFFVPAKIEELNFKGYVKIGFEDSYPQLEALSCRIF